MKQRFALLIVLCLFLTMLQNVSASDQTSRATNPNNNFLSFGILTGIAQHNIYLENKIFNPDYVSNNTNLYFGVFSHFLLKKISIEASVDYKTRAFLLHNYAWDDYGYVLDSQMQYINTSLKLGVFFTIIGLKSNLFAGIGSGYLINATRKYVVDYWDVRTSEKWNYKDSERMKKYLDRNSIQYSVGITFEPDALSKRVNLGVDVDLFRPTNEYARKVFDGNWDPLYRPFWLSSVTLFLKIKLFTI